MNNTPRDNDPMNTLNSAPTIERQRSIVPKWLPVLIGNLIPLYGVLFWGWDVFSVFFLYWVENVIIGFYTALKMFGVGLSIFLQDNPFSKIGAVIGTSFFIGFFTIHYGMFTMGHFSFLTSFFYEGDLEIPNFDTYSTYLFVKGVAHGGLFWGILAICIAEGIKATQDFGKPSLIEKQILSGKLSPEAIEKLKAKNPRFDPENISKFSRIPHIMMSPYGRIIVLHITLIFGGMMAEFLHQPMWALGLLIVLKIMYDLGTLNPMQQLKKRKANA